MGHRGYLLENHTNPVEPFRMNHVFAMAEVIFDLVPTSLNMRLSIVASYVVKSNDSTFADQMIHQRILEKCMTRPSLN
jgi:hypothetical protein